MEHIDAMDDLREGIGLRAYAQRDPIVEYRLESFDMFEQMINEIKDETVRHCLTVRIKREEQLKREQVATPLMASHGEEEVKKTVKKGAKVGRNDPCPCGSGKKYKKCCGENE
jgi:preprotein translocase subunit SecA